MSTGNSRFPLFYLPISRTMKQMFKFFCPGLKSLIVVSPISVAMSSVDYVSFTAVLNAIIFGQFLTDLARQFLKWSRQLRSTLSVARFCGVNLSVKDMNGTVRSEVYGRK